MSSQLRCWQRARSGSSDVSSLYKGRLRNVVVVAHLRPAVASLDVQALKRSSHRRAIVLVQDEGARLAFSLVHICHEFGGLVVALEGAWHLNLAPSVRKKLMAVSPATIDRLRQPVAPREYVPVY